MTSTPTPCLDLNYIVCRDLEASRHITPGPPPTLGPEFLTREAAYLAWLTQQPPTPETTSTPTPEDPRLAAVLPAERAGFVRVRARSDYQDRPLFQVEYALAEWEREGVILKHRQLPDCKLELVAGGSIVRGPLEVTKMELGGYLSTVRYFRGETQVTYEVDLEEGYYLFQLNLPQNVTGEATQQCRAAAETVLGTFDLMLDDLPAGTPTLSGLPAKGETPAAVPAQEGWTTHRAPFFSFQYPSDWRIEDAGTGQYVGLYPPKENPRRRIEIAYLGKEIGEGESLLTWYRAYLRAAHGEPLPEIRVLHHETLPQPDGSQRQVLHTAMITEMGPSQAIKITYGRLVLSIGTYTYDEAATQILKRIAGSIEFTPNAPRTINELLSAQR